MFVCTIKEKDEGTDSDTLTCIQPDGNIFFLTSMNDSDLDALVKGGQYTLAFVPFGAALDGPVPVDHPIVLDPNDAADAAPAPVPADPTVGAGAGVAPTGIATQRSAASTESSNAASGDAAGTARSGQ